MIWVFWSAAVWHESHRREDVILHVHQKRLRPTRIQ